MLWALTDATLKVIPTALWLLLNVTHLLSYGTLFKSSEISPAFANLLVDRIYYRKLISQNGMWHKRMQTIQSSITQGSKLWQLLHDVQQFGLSVFSRGTTFYVKKQIVASRKFYLYFGVTVAATMVEQERWSMPGERPKEAIKDWCKPEAYRSSKCWTPWTLHQQMLQLVTAIKLALPLVCIESFCKMVLLYRGNPAHFAA